MDIPNVWKIRVEIRHIGVSNMYSDEDYMYVLGYSKEEVERKIIPILQYKEKQNKGVQLIVKEIHKLFPLHYLSEEIIETILKVNMKDYMMKREEELYDEKHGKKKRLSNLSPF